MKVGIMQPYFFPYIGYFSLIKYTDEFVFFDTPQYISHGWVNRNRVLGQNKEPVYIIVPIRKAPRETPIMDIKINSEMNWREKIYGQLTVYKKKAPNYNETIELVHSLLDVDYGDDLSLLNIETTKKVCEYLGLERKFQTFSKMDIAIDEVNEPDEWALNITKAMGYDTYVNPPGGMSFFNREKYENAGIRLEFLEAQLQPYVQRIGHFEPGLSIIDVMMFCKKDEITDMLDEYKIL